MKPLLLSLLCAPFLSAETQSITLPNGPAIDFVYVAPGTFWRGSPDAEVGRDADEGPRHSVQLTKGFYLGKYEVTQAQWRAVMGSNPAALSHPGDDEPGDRPIESVSWRQVQTFIDKLNALGLGRFRLPTEAEWEFAARAGSSTAFPWSDAVDINKTHQFAWANSRSMATTHAVGQKPPNAWGLYDMHGNVWEWCADWYAPYSAAPQLDPQGPARGSERVFRGGSWFDFPVSLRSANRHRHSPERGYSAIGFRLLMEPLPTEQITILLPGQIPLRFAHLPAGSFSMGSAETEVGRQRDESPAHPVTIAKPFWLGVYEVTQAQWAAVMGTDPSVFRLIDDAGALPVDRVSWIDVQEFLERLNRLGLGRFRLPTEAEWEYAARAGTTTRYSFGDDPSYAELPRYGWFNPRSEGRPHPVGRKLPNPWGLYDMHGGVWEWCADWFAPYSAHPAENPIGPPSGTNRIIRGGSWFNEPEALRSANRHQHLPTNRLTNLGLRLVREP